MDKRGLVYRFSKEGNIHTLYIYDSVTKRGEFNWKTWQYDESETSAKYFRDQLNEIPDGDTIHLHINSQGGEVGEGVTIYNLLRQKSQAGCNIVGYVDGMAYSVAADIAMACDELHMGLGTSMLLHFPWMWCAGNANQLREYADQLDALGEASVQLYMSRAKDLTAEELREMMRKETVLDPESCLKYGFCDVVDQYKKAEEDQGNDPAEDPEDDPDKMLNQLQRELQETKEMLRVQQEINKAFISLKPQQEPAADPISKQEPAAPVKATVSETLMKAMQLSKGGNRK